MAVSRVELASEAAMAQQMYSRGDGRAATAQDGANTPTIHRADLISVTGQEVDVWIVWCLDC